MELWPEDVDPADVWIIDQCVKRKRLGDDLVGFTEFETCIVDVGGDAAPNTHFKKIENQQPKDASPAA